MFPAFAGADGVLELINLLGFALFVHQLLVLPDPFLHGLVDFIAFPAFVQLEIVRGVGGKGQFLGGVGQKRHGRLHHRRRIAEQRTHSGGRGGKTRVLHRAHALLPDGKINGHVDGSGFPKRLADNSRFRKLCQNRAELTKTRFSKLSWAVRDGKAPCQIIEYRMQRGFHEDFSGVLSFLLVGIGLFL